MRRVPQPLGPRLHLPEGHPARDGPRQPIGPPPGFYAEPNSMEEIDVEEEPEGVEFDPVDLEPTPTSVHETRQEEGHERREEEDPVVEDEPVSPGGSPDRQPEGEDDLDGVPENSSPNEDWWDQTEHCIIRHHFEERNTLFYPSGSRMDLPVDLARLQDSRVTVKHYTTGDVEVVRDNWREGYRQVFTRTSHGVNRFQAGPSGARLVRRITTNLDTGGCIADENERALSRVHHYTRLLPDGVRNIRSDFYLVDDGEDEKEWTGTTTFKLKPLTEELREEPCSLEPEIDKKKSMSKGQRKQLEKKIEVLEDSDMAMWSAIHRQPVHLPRPWKIVLELFCGCALLTRMFQAKGYETCEPLDIHMGWDVFNPDHRKKAELMMDQENPYLLAMGFPCGPWSPFQHLNPDQEKVKMMRRKWTPILAWVRHLVEKQHRKGGKSLLENPWTSEAWNTKEMAMLIEEYGGIDGMKAVKIHQCSLGLCDIDSGKPHKKATAIVTDSSGVQRQFQGKLCHGQHEHQPLEGSNSGGSRTKQAAKWTSAFCRCILRGIQNDLQETMNVAFAAEMRMEEIEEDPHPLDAVYGEEDLPTAKETIEEQERSIAREEQLEQLEREADPQSEKVRRAGWLKLGRTERIGIRRLHAMTSHATRPQMQRMLRFSNAPATVVSAVKFFRCSACEKLNEEKRVQVTKAPSAYVFGELVGTDVFEIKDAEEERFHVLHTVCEGTTYQAGDILGVATGVPSSKSCLESFLRYWCSWAGFPKTMKVDRGTHNRGVFQAELEKLGVEVRSIATEAPYQIGRTERAGGTLKRILVRIVQATQATGKLEMQLALVQALDCKNRYGTHGGFSPAQWVLGKNPRAGGWSEIDEQEVVVLDEDPSSTFNRRAAIREAARAAWAYEDSSTRVRKAMLRKGGPEQHHYQQGDLVSFMRRRGGSAKWFGPARVLTTEGKNVWLLHGGVPILTSDTMIRPSSPEEHLEAELLGGRRGTKRTKGVVFKDVEQIHHLRPEEKPSYMDFRGYQDEGESFEEILGVPTPKMPTGVGIAPTVVAEDDDESPKRMRRLIQEEEDKKLEEQEGQEVRAEDVPVGDGEDSVDYAPTTPAEDENEEKEVKEVKTASRPFNLLEVMSRGGGNQMDVGRTRARAMPSTERSRGVDEILQQPGTSTTTRDRSRSPPEVLKKEFHAFMAKRAGKKKADPEVSGELVYARETEEVQRALDETRGKEWSNWLKYRATRIPTKEEVDKIMKKGGRAIPMKWVELDKNAKLRVEGGPSVERKLKSRLVLRGDLEPGDFRVDCPTTSAVGTHLVFSFAACGGYQLYAGDITAAFLQGAPIQRELLMKVPSTGIPNVDGKGYALEPGSHLIAQMSIYGSRDAPRGFWLALREEILGQGMREVEPALYALSGPGGKLHGLAATHVDDVLWAGDEVLQEAMRKIQERFTFGTVEIDGFRFCGRKVESTDDYYQITSPEILTKVKPIRIEGHRNRNPVDQASDEEQSQMRAVLGSIGYVARLCRPELSYRCSALQGKQSRPTLQDLINTNKFLAAAQKTTGNGIRFFKKKFNFETAVLLSVTDASHAAELHVSQVGKPDGHKSQAGRFLFLADKMPTLEEAANVHVLEWSSHTIKRVCRSTLQAEVLSSMDGSESGQYVRNLLYAMAHPRDDEGDRGRAWKIWASDSRVLHWLTDCRSFTEYMSSGGQGIVSDKRLAIDLTALRQDIWRRFGSEFGEPSVQESIPEDGSDKLWWICTRDMVADGLTKSMVWNAIIQVTTTGRFGLTVKPIQATYHTGS